MSSAEMDLVTGATGFIGSHLTERLLAGGRRVRVLCRPGSERKLLPGVRDRVEVAAGDLGDPESLLRAARGAGRVFHCAGHVSDWGADARFEETNVRGTRWLLEGARAAGCRRFVHLSSIAAFGTPAPAYFDDDSPRSESRDPYSRSKARGEDEVFAFGRNSGLPVVVLRPAVVYGPRGTWLEEPLRMIEQGKMFLLGGGEGTCHPCYVENLCDAIVLAAEHPAAVGEGFIVTDGESVSFREYFDAVAQIAGKGPIRRSIPLPAARLMASLFERWAEIRRTRERPLLTQAAIDMVTTRSRVSIRKIREKLGFRPRYDFRAAMRELEGWYAREKPKLAA